MQLDCLWAKTDPFQSVLTHGKVSGTVAQALFLSYLSNGTRAQLCAFLSMDEETLSAFLGYLVSLHDIGKIEPHFQEKRPGMRELLASEALESMGVLRNVRHEYESRRASQNCWKEIRRDARTADLMSNVLGAHHQGKHGEHGKPGTLWQDLQKQFDAAMRSYFSFSVFLPSCPKEHLGTLGAILLAITILSDWIASGKYFDDAESWIASADGKRLIIQRAERFIQESGLTALPVEWGKRFCAVWPNIPEEGKRCLQEQTEALFSESEERISALLIEAPMGEGKTECGIFSALQMAASWGKEGFYVAMPTSATANQMVGRLRQLLEYHDSESCVRLLHAMAWLVDSQTPDREQAEAEPLSEMRRWLEPVRRGLLGQFAVGTVDQAMLSVSMAKHSVLRLLGLSGKALIIDEIHSYDVYMDAFLVRLLEWCRALEIPVVMLSATLPPKLKQRLLSPYTSESFAESYPCLTAITESGKVIQRHVPKTSRRQAFSVRLLPVLYRPEAIAEAAVKRVNDGGCLCVLMNTVHQAQSVYRALKRLPFEGETLLFHARFPAARRDEIEKQCLEWFGPPKGLRPKRAILVATQVVEQSLDVDFDGMMTAIAPIDLVLQRIGRVWRHADTQRPDSFRHAEVDVLVPEKPRDWKQGDNMVYPPCLLNQSLNLLKDRTEIHIPEDLAQLVTDGYDEEKAPAEESSAWLDKLVGDAVAENQAESALVGPPEKTYTPLRQNPAFSEDDGNGYLSVKTRLSEPSVRLALLDKSLYARIEALATTREGKRIASVTDHNLAKEVLSQSVSLSKKQVSWVLSDLSDISGDKLLSGVEIIPIEDGVFCSGSDCIRNDRELGVLLERSEI